jgi:BASS family bile acid:Na+ symporter
MDNTSTIILAISLIIIMLGMGLSLVVDDFKRILSYPKAMFVGLTNQLVLLPLIGFAIASLFPIRPEIAVGIMLLAACPGGPTSNLISHLAKADLALSVSLTAVSSVITIFTIPFIVNFALNHFLSQKEIITLDIPQTIIQIFVIIVIPISIGMLIRHRKPEFALRMEKPVRQASTLVFILVFVGIILKERAHMKEYLVDAGLVAILLNLATMLVGFFSARLFRIKAKRALSIAIESGIQNGTLAISIAVALLGNTEYAIAAAVYSIFMFISGGVAIYFGLRMDKRLSI